MQELDMDTLLFFDAHRAALPLFNRSRHKDPDGITGIALQKKDWAKIKTCLEEMKPWSLPSKASFYVCCSP